MPKTKKLPYAIRYIRYSLKCVWYGLFAPTDYKHPEGVNFWYMPINKYKKTVDSKWQFSFQVASISRKERSITIPKVHLTLNKQQLRLLYSLDNNKICAFLSSERFKESARAYQQMSAKKKNR